MDFLLILSAMKPTPSPWSTPLQHLPDGLGLLLVFFLATTSVVLAKPLTEEDISQLLASGRPPAQIVDMLKKDGYSGPLNKETVSKLRTAGAPPELILALSTHARAEGSTAPSEPVKIAYTNSLGMKFVAVPGSQVLFCIHPTRVSDYRAYADVNLGGTARLWQSGGADHPATHISWEDAMAFCQWLSKTEDRSYRLPTDHEWSCALGIGDQEDAQASPLSKSDKIPGVYAWGTQWPPPAGAGNLADRAYKRIHPGPEYGGIEDYDDGFDASSPVMSFQANRLGLYDMAGNVWQWCDDWRDSEERYRVTRGSSFATYRQGELLASHRSWLPPAHRAYYVGFRVVVAP